MGNLIVPYLFIATLTLDISDGCHFLLSMLLSYPGVYILVLAPLGREEISADVSQLPLYPFLTSIITYLCKTIFNAHLETAFSYKCYNNH